MTKQAALDLLERTLDLPSRTLTGSEALRDVEAWDSMSTLAFIADVDRELGLPLAGNQVARCRTVAELLALLGVPASNAA